MVKTRDIRRDRWNTVLDVIVSTFRDTREPVSSHYIAEHCGLGLCPATIRNVMRELEDEGFLCQPHTSAGRIPTAKGYRYYVDYLMMEPGLSEPDAEHITMLLEQITRENEAAVFMDSIARMLSEVTDLVGVVMTPLFNLSVFDRLEIVNLGGSRYLLILSMKNGLVRTINLTLDHVLMRTRVEETARILSDRLHGLTIGEIKNTIGDRMRHLSGGDRILVDVILSNREQIFSSDGQENIHISGISRLLELPEFSDVQNSQKLINLSENKLKISDHLWARFSHSTGMAIDIGESDLLDGALPLSIVAASCFSQGTPGILGVIGPTRIDYPRILAIIKHTASMTTHFFSS